MSLPRTDAVARFSADWQRSLHSDRIPPQISDYVPDGTQVRLGVLVDLIRVDLRRRWQREGLGKRVADYRAEFPDVETSPELVDLLCEEFLARRRRGPLPLEDFLAEYPDRAGAVREHLADFAADAAGSDAESAEAVAALADLAPGLRIDDFDLLTDLGAGLLGRVFLARQRSMQRLVAVRFSAGRAGAAHTMAQLDHAHIVRVFDQRVLSADAAQALTVAGPPANGRHTAASATVATPHPDLGTTAGELFDLDATAPPGRTSRPGDDETIGAPPTRTADHDDETIAAPPTRTADHDDETIAAPPTRTADHDDETVLEPRGSEWPPSTVTHPSTAGGATAAPEDIDDETVVGEPDRSAPVRQRHGPIPDSGRSAQPRDSPAILACPDAVTERSIDPDATIAAPPDDTASAALPVAPESRTAAFPRLVYMQYLPGGTAVDLLAQRRRGPVTDGGALLLRAVDNAMEAKGEIRPSDSSVRAEIARLTWPETVAWVGRRLADALDYAAHHGVLHHDIKPANVLFTAEGIPKLADFTLGEVGGRTAPHGPGAADALVYRSPEQLTRYLDPDAPAPSDASDVYSLGVLLWEMLTGATPFDDPPLDRSGPDAETYERMLAVRRGGVSDAALARLPDDTPAALRRVLLDCLHENPKRRWRGGAELAGQLDLCLDSRARDLVDPPHGSLAHRARGWLLPVAALCVGVPNVLASFYNIQLNQTLIIDRMSTADQEKFAAVGLINNLVAFPVAALLLLFMTRRPLAISYRLGHGDGYSARTLAKARRDTLLMGDWAVWIPFGFWLVAGIIWPLGLAFSGVDLPRGTFLHFFAAQVVCAAIALAYPFFPIMVYSVRAIYPQLLVRGGIGPDDERQLRALARRGSFYLGVAASVPLLGVASATFVEADDLELVIVPVRVLSVGGILAFVLTYRLFRLLEADLLALARAIPQRTR
ncbi:protein kinase domain-containing protein [Nocardia araoensis]|uniref:protein kinase domain-containing protein n=1 Tax=Nocardia araoensis TaxID=228600 RepID=UPI00030E1672|nr:protein kinase [Nocardia araoensis]